MKKLFAIAFLLLSISVFAQWTQTASYLEGEYNGFLSCPSVVYMSTSNGISIFNASSGTWSIVDLSGFTSESYDLWAADDSLLVFADPYWLNIVISKDMGKTWTAGNPVPSSETLLDIFCMNHTLIAIATDKKMYYSNDAAQTWKQIPFNELIPENDLIAACSANTFYIYNKNSSFENWLYKTDFDGSTFSPIVQLKNLGQYNYVDDMLILNENIYYACYDGLYCSRNQGSSFSKIYAGAISKIEADSSKLYLGGDSFYNSIGVYDPQANAFTDINLEGSTNVILQSFGICDGGIFAMIFDPYDNPLSGFEIIRYWNGNWTSIGALPVGARFSEFGSVKVIDNAIFTDYSIWNNYYLGEKGVAYSVDAGKSYYFFKGSNLTSFNDACKINSVYLVAGDGGVAVADLTNGTLTQTSGCTAGVAKCLLTFNGTLYLGTDNGIFTSADNGLHWTYKSMNGKVINKMTAYENNLYAATDAGLFFSANGSSWSTSDCPYQQITDVSADDNEIYVVSPIGIVTLADTNGQHYWKPIGTSLVGTDVNSILTYAGRVYAGTNHGSVMFTDDKGNTWSDISCPEFDTVTRLDISGGRLYASEFKHGVWSTYIGYPTGIDNRTDFKPKVYPNPVENILNIELSRPLSGSIVVDVFDVTGKRMFRVTQYLKGEKNVTIDMKEIPSGIYIVKIASDEAVFSMKISKS